jgi:hypothetical protein
VVVGEEPKLLVFALLVVKPDSALPAAFLLMVEFTEVSDDVLPRTSLGSNAFNQGVVDMRLAVLGSPITSQKHCGLPATK